MRHLLNTLYVMTEDSYLALEGENIVILQEEKKLGRYPLHTLESIQYFGYKGASPALMGACAKRNIALNFFTPNGRFLAHTSGMPYGNVVLRRTQYRAADDERQSCQIARNMVAGKVYNCRWCLERTTRDHPMRVDVARIKKASGFLAQSIREISACESMDVLRGLEGEAASVYFSVFDELILNQKEDFFFHERTRRPPLDRVNALLSFVYTLLANDCASALMANGLDPYVGFLHRDRPGRASLALDLMEELRGTLADRFVISLINQKTLKAKQFEQKENGAVIMSDQARKELLSAWQNKKREIITHPFLKEKMPWGLVPFVQAQLLARYLREDLDEYPPFLWK